MIPKIIHYCWYGDSPIPKEYEGYIKEWKKLNPGYKIIRWDEKNSPINIPYIKKAISHKNWANVSNLIRFYALKEHGGIYMDTDMKLIKQLNPLLKNSCFFGFEEGADNSDIFWVNNAIIGSTARHKFITLCYNSILKEFDGTEAANLSAPQIVTKLLKKHYKLVKYGFQKLEDITLYTKDVFYPIPWDSVKQTKAYEKYISPATIAVHMWGRTWFSKEMMLQMIDDLQEWKKERTAYLSNLEIQLNSEKASSLIAKDQYLKDLQTIQELKSHLDSFATKLINFNEKLDIIKEDEKLTFEICQNLISFLTHFEQTVSGQHTVFSKIISNGHEELIKRIENQGQEFKQHIDSSITQNEQQLYSFSEKLLIKQTAIENILGTKNTELKELSEKLLIKQAAIENISSKKNTELKELSEKLLIKQTAIENILGTKNTELKELSEKLLIKQIALESLLNEKGTQLSILSEKSIALEKNSEKLSNIYVNEHTPALKKTLGLIQEVLAMNTETNQQVITIDERYIELGSHLKTTYQLLTKLFTQVSQTDVYTKENFTGIEKKLTLITGNQTTQTNSTREQYLEIEKRIKTMESFASSSFKQQINYSNERFESIRSYINIKNETAITTFDQKITQFEKQLQNQTQENKNQFKSLIAKGDTFEKTIHELQHQFSKQKQESATQFAFLVERINNFETIFQEREAILKQIEQKNISIEWYKSTYENRSVLGIIKDRIFKKKK